MKHLIIAIGAICFSTLFYGKGIGLNLSLFSILTIILLIFFNSNAFRHRKVIVISTLYLISGGIVFVQLSLLSILSNLVLLFTLLGAVSERRASIYVYWFNGIYSSVAGFFQKQFEASTKPKSENANNVDIIHRLKLIGFPLIFIVLFTFLYKNGNPFFKDIVEAIDLSIIDLNWILFTLLGFFVLSNISEPVSVEPATQLDLNTSNDLINRNSASVESLNKELQLGVTLLGLLNLLILVYIITDIAFLVQFDELSNAQLSQQVHQGIYTLIVSIIIAIGIILIVFRGNLNFYKSNVNLKRLAYVWIFLNIVLIVLTAIKNQNYIFTLGLTHKRIGVHIYLFLVLSGLITTYIKVKYIKNLAYLFRMNTQITTAILILCSLVNWDKEITAYNLNKAQQFDIKYLLQLSDSNAKYLYLYRNAIPISETDRARIVNKYDLYSSRVYSRSWQEWQLDNLTLNHQKSDFNYEYSE